MPHWASCSINRKVFYGLACRIGAPPGLEMFFATTAKQISDASAALAAAKATDKNTVTYSQTKAVAKPWWYGVFGTQNIRVSAGEHNQTHILRPQLNLEWETRAQRACQKAYIVHILRASC